ncbi:MAG: zf-HC2 domain-containing protein [Candidatus Erginobacter occultus]|nr:zf-HC2 domain-containing protein [Candidatus Erginobacter occultus]
MNCKRFQRELPGYLYGDLSAGERDVLAGHAGSCPACRRLLTEMEETVSLLAAEPGPIFSGREKELLRGRVMEAVRELGLSPRPLPSRGGLKFLLRPLLFPAALAAAVLLLVLFRGTDDPSAAAPPAAALAAFSEEVEDEFQLFADVWSEIEEIESLFSPEPGTGSEAEWRGGEEPIRV